MTIVDRAERESALDPLRSFCVSAPAGSGKTELLIQRYLCLLARVRSPEQVLAITFTRKAAAEMRERVLQALGDARDGLPCSGDHQQRTRELAQATLAVDESLNWQLLANSSRLNIRTIDGFCATLTRQMPVLSQFGAQATAVDDPSPLYAEAVVELFALVGGDHPVAPDLRRLMLHFDNNWDRLAEVLQGLLARRDQWLTYVGVHRTPEASERQLRGTLEHVLTGLLQGVASAMSPFLPRLFALQQYAATNLELPVPESPPRARIEDLDGWRALRRLLLTADGSKWRSRLDKNGGFPAGKGEAAERKEEALALIDAMSAVDGLRETLLEVDLMPSLDEGDENWQLVLCLSHVLPWLAAQLLLVFQRHGSVDHSQVAQSALQALGDDEAPTDLALRLDYRIEHILVDEFQDTAINQFELVRRLTRGWGEHNAANPAAPRTLFIVGDGMQSIYGFRDANVGLFLQARDQGFNGVLPQFLELRSNFRSHAGVVEWVNATFSQVFPAADDITRGEVSFRPATAIKPAEEGAAVSLSVYCGDQAVVAEVEQLCQAVTEALSADTVSSIAILGRSRPQLQAVVAGLRARRIDFGAPDMERLQYSPVILDLLSLTRVLANRADQVAAWSLLRAPWCGLTLADMHALARSSDVLAAVNGDAVPAGLSPDGLARFGRVSAAIDWAESRRDRLALRAWVEQAWLRLGGPGTVVESQRLGDAEQFFRLLERSEQEGRALDIPWLEAQLERLYADVGGVGARVQVMTLHKAKGLEFDHVFIPSLARGSASDQRQLLLWDEYSDNQGQRGFLLAADDHSDRNTPGLYNFLARQRQRKQLLENTRLLYVGATRAIRRLHLSATLAIDPRSGEARPPGRQTLLACIWPAAAASANMVEADDTPQAPPDAVAGGLLRFRELPAPPGSEPPGAGAGDGNVPGYADNRLDRHCGTVVHLALEHLAASPDLPPAPDSALEDLCRWAFACLGVHGDEQASGLQRAKEAIARTLADHTAGRWLLRADHVESATELPLTRVGPGGEISNIVIDRTFIDAATGTRWIIDYKTSSPAEGAETGDFLAEESARYSAQLLAYRDALVALGPQPVRCALYFTALGHLLPVELGDAS